MSFYIYAEQVGNRIFHRYVDDQGKIKNEVVKSFPIELYVKTNRDKVDATGLMGEKLGKVEFEDIVEASGFVREYKDAQEIYGQTFFLYQFLSKTYPGTIEFDITQIPIMFLDLECAYDESGFPHPSRASQEILSIACKVNGDHPYVVFGSKPCNVSGIEYVECRDEEDLLRQFQQYWIKVNPAIVSGYNCIQFDLPYIINRSTNVMGEDFTKKYSCFHKNLDKCIQHYEINEKNSGVKVVGTTAIDFMELYKQFSSGPKLESYRLEVVAQQELGAGKVDYSEYDGLMGLYRDNYDLFITYNKMDTELVELMEKKLNFIFLALTMGYLGKVRFDDIYSQVRFWDTYIYNGLQSKNIQIPPTKHKPHQDIVGAFVKESVPGLYEWVVTMDLVSLYPSIIRTFNLSPETLVSEWSNDVSEVDEYIRMEKDLSFAKKKNVTVLANGSTYTREKQGIFTELVTDMFKKRKDYQGKKKAALRELETIDAEIANKGMTDELAERNRHLQSQVATFDTQQLAFKRSLASLYGATANQYFRYNNRSIAEGITITGQLIIRFISERLNKKLNKMFKTENVDYAVGNDTDSCFITLKTLVDKMFPEKADTNKIINFLDKFVKTHISPFIADEYEQLAEYMNAYENCLTMNREVIADRGLFRGKKNYILQVWDKEGFRYAEPKLKMMGIETAKSSTPNIVRGSLEKAIKILLNKPEDDLYIFVAEFKKQFWQAPVSEIAFPRGISDLDKYSDENGNPKKGCPIHVRGALSYNNLLRKYKLTGTHPLIHNGNKIKFLYLKKENPSRQHVIAFFDELPKEFNLETYVDRDLQYDKTFLDPLKSFTDIINWKTEETMSLDSFFS